MWLNQPNSSFVVQTHGAAPMPRSANIEPVRLDALRRKLIASSSGRLKLVADWLADYTAPLALLWFSASENVLHLRDREERSAEALNESELQQCIAQAAACCRQQVSAVHAVGPAKQLVCVPVAGSGFEPQVVCGVFAADRFCIEVVAWLQIAVSHLVLAQLASDCRELEAEAESASALNELLSRVNMARDLRRACYTLVDDIQRYSGCHRVALGLIERGGECRLRAVSGMARLDRHSEFAAAMEAALCETVARDAVTFWPPRDDSQRHALLAHEKLAALVDQQQLASAALKDDKGQLVGAWLFIGQSANASESAMRGGRDRGETLSVLERIVEAWTAPLASSLDVSRRAERGLLGRATSRLREAMRTARGRTMAVAAAMLLALLAVPVPYRVSCTCKVEPVKRRFIVAPYDGTLQRAYVAAGDTVSAGDVLARLDDRELRLERAGLEADFARASKRRDAALAVHSFAEAQQAKLEMEQLEAKIQLLEHREQNLEIRSALDGIVISGDLEKTEGARLTTGQTLFEIAPLAQMLVEVAVPEDEIAFVQPRMTADVKLDAYERDWRGHVQRIHPRSEIQDHENVFIAEVPLDNPSGLLRPGMNGHAKISTGKQSLAWVLFHKPSNALLRWLGW